jgi:hypothetical protein
LAGMGTTREDVALSGIADALSWRRTLEVVDYDHHPHYKLPSQRVIVYPKFLGKINVVLATGNIGMDSQDSRWPVYEEVLTQAMAWGDNCQPIMLPRGVGQLDEPLPAVSGESFKTMSYMGTPWLAYGSFRQEEGIRTRVSRLA